MFLNGSIFCMHSGTYLVIMFCPRFQKVHQFWSQVPTHLYRGWKLVINQVSYYSIFLQQNLDFKGNVSFADLALTTAN